MPENGSYWEGMKYKLPQKGAINPLNRNVGEKKVFYYRLKITRY